MKKNNNNIDKIKTIKTILLELREGADEMISFGDSNEKSFGAGMMEVIMVMHQYFGDDSERFYVSESDIDNYYDLKK